jgi:GNAT superfamily N-acetyltransferase
MSIVDRDVGDVEIRRANRTDIEPINTLIGASVRALSVGFYSPQQIEASIQHLFGVDTQLVDDRTYYVAEVHGELAAAGGWSARLHTHGGDQTKTGADPFVDPSKDPARIRAFFVEPRFARRGIARRLFEKCEGEARECGFRRLTLMATLPGVPLYLALGFEARGDVDVPLPHGLTFRCVHMARSI